MHFKTIYRLRPWALCAGFLVVLVAGTALADNPTAAEFWYTDSTLIIGAETWEGTEGVDDGPHTFIEALRGPVVAGTTQISVKIETGQTDLLSMRFLVADDTNSNNQLDASEWQVVATATVSQSGGIITAQTGTFTVSASKDGYRVEHTWTSQGTVFDEVRKTWLLNPWGGGPASP